MINRQPEGFRRSLTSVTRPGPSPVGARRVAISATLALSALGVARADDWPQFRRDAQRTGASRDRVKPPLTDIWDEPGGTPPIVWRGRVFSVRTGGLQRVLVCLDARTGKTLWRQSLALSRNPALDASHSDPVVSENGLLYVQDLDRGRPVLRALDPFTGRQVAVATQGQKFLVGVRHPGHLPIGSGPAGVAAVNDFGSLLVVGNELVSFGIGSQVARWNPGEPLRVFSLLHAPRVEEEQPFEARLYRNVPTLAPTGVVVTGSWPFIQFPERHREDGTNFVAMLDGSGQIRWHHEVPEMPGVPVVGTGTLFLPTLSGLVALDLNGNLRWSSAAAASSSNPSRLMYFGDNRKLVRRQYVVTQGRIFDGHCVAREQGTGQVAWKHTTRGLSLGWALAATPEHLLVFGTGRLSAVRLTDGKIVWMRGLPVESGDIDTELALSGGLVFVGGAKSLRTLATAERTFHLAVDSPHLAHYRLHPPAEESLPEEGGTGVPPAPESPPPASTEQNPGTNDEKPAPENGKPEEGKPAPPAPKPEVADSTLLRLRWDGPPAELVRRTRDRRTQVPGIPMTVVLEWLDSTRARPIGLAPEGWTDAQIRRYAGVCRDLAEAAQPRYFDVAPEVNVFLLRRPEQLERVRAMLRAVRKSVAEVSPETKVCASFNAEALSGHYGLGSFQPFGPLPMPQRRAETSSQIQRQIHAMQVTAAELVAEVDAMGLTSYPQAGFRHFRELPADYLLSLKPLARGKPILVLSLQARYAAGKLPPEVEQFQFLRRMIQLCYWLDARLVAYPAALGSTGADAEPLAALVEKPAQSVRNSAPQAGSEAAERPASEKGSTRVPRPALSLWCELLAWRQVDRLSATIPDPTRPLQPHPE